jgi:hypothetical protein
MSEKFLDYFAAIDLSLYLLAMYICWIIGAEAYWFQVLFPSSYLVVVLWEKALTHKKKN